MTDELTSKWVTGDTRPAIRARIPLLGIDQQPTGQYADLTTADHVNFQMRRPDDKRFTVNALAEIVGDPATGTVRYEWAVNDLSVPGEYDVQWEVTWDDTTIQTTVAERITVRRQ